LLHVEVRLSRAEDFQSTLFECEACEEGELQE
jgi:hypothetical protein